MKVDTLGRGVYLPDLKLALDTSAPGYHSIVSHAHGDHIPWEASHAYATRETADIVAIRAPHLRVTELPWGEPTRVGAAKVTMLPAGHILGSALTLVEAPDGETLLYTADTKTRPSRTTPQASFPRADALIVESTFGLPIYRFPETEALERKMGDLARAALAEGAVPVFLGYALGKSQEILAILHAQGVPTVAHGAVWNMCQVYERHGVRFPTTRPYEPARSRSEGEDADVEPQRDGRVRGKVEGAALVVPGSFRAHPMVEKLDARIVYCSGWALLSKSRVQLDADALVPLSDHADFPGLLDIVEQVGARRVYTNHGYADMLAHMLRKEGLDATPLHVGHLEEDAAPVADGQARLEDA